MLDELRVAADEAAGTGGEEILRAAFADAGDAGVGLDGDDDVALIEDLVDLKEGLGWIVDADAGDLHFGQSAEGGERARRQRRQQWRQGIEEIYGVAWEGPPIQGDHRNIRQDGAGEGLQRVPIAMVGWHAWYITLSPSSEVLERSGLFFSGLRKERVTSS